MAYLGVTLRVAEADRAAAAAYLQSDLFTHDVVGGLTPLLASEPEIRVYETA